MTLLLVFTTSREGLSSTKATKPLSSNLLLDCHSEGYVATSSKSHETYLRLWAKYLDCSIVSVDYSLAPKFPFPRPNKEVLYAYSWILKNPEKFGWDGKKLLMVRDSAGGNLIVSVALRLAQLKAARMPDGLIPTDCNFESQSILSLMNLSNMSVLSSPLNGQTLVAPKNRSTDEATREGELKSLNNSIDETNTIESEEQREENENATVYVNRSPSMTNLAADDDVFESENGQNAAELNGGRRLFNCTTPVRICDPRTRTCSTPKLTRAAQKEAEKVETSLSELLKLNLSRDCLISPMYAPDELLREVPTCRFISCHLDPLLDDTITFAKKHRNAGGRVAGFNERRVHEGYGSIPNRLQLLRPNTTILIKATDYVSKLQVFCL
ncbi:Hydrolase, alpha/beta domain protein [Aphelenchoides besseyi]|nr:Hydrolase, alpha/beta domain protein [Aphelenchoides besseyi]